MMTGEKRYQLNLTMAVVEVTNQGDAERPYWSPNHQNSLRVEQSVDLGALDFLGVAKVLGSLHDAATDISARAVSGD